MCLRFKVYTGGSCNAMEKFGCVHVAIIDTWGRENWDFRHNISYFS